MKTSEIQSIKQRFGIIGGSPLLDQAVSVAAQIAPTDMGVLITGESGSGKESFSKIIHSLGARKHNEFIAINCGAMPEGTIDSELFGHEKGSFTGAHEARKGYFEVAHQGTIFLDEIGEMPLGTQARLLRVLENGEFIKVGSSKVQKTDVRVIAATHVNLIGAVKSKKFREDLYYRLSTVPIYVPALRERGTDVDMLFRKFVYDFGEKYRVEPVQLTPEAREVLNGYRFPGNIRELKNIAEQISVLEINRTLSATDLLKYIPEESNNLPALIATPKNNFSDNFLERDLLYKVLFEMRNDMSELKKLVLQILSGKPINQTELLEKYGGLFDVTKEYFSEPDGQSDVPVILNPRQRNISSLDLDKVRDMTHETEQEETLSISKKEKELIIKALKKHNNKKRHAAKDLDISERTLYRKIKYYGLED